MLHCSSTFTLLFSSIQPCATMRQAADVRVGSNPHQEPPGASSEVHFSGSRGQTNLDGVFNAVSPPKAALKRSFLRAQRRAMQHGGTQYKGRWYSAQQVGLSNTTQLSPDPGSQFRQTQALGCTSCPGMQEVSPQIAMPSYVLGFQSQLSSAWT